jgi:hypothetical protein
VVDGIFNDMLKVFLRIEPGHKKPIFFAGYPTRQYPDEHCVFNPENSACAISNLDT